MHISEYSVKNYQFTLVIFLMIVALGVTTLLTMPRSEDPDINAPQFPVVVIYPGTSPQDMEELVVDPLEKKISELEDIKKIQTTIKDGVAVITVYYKYESNVNEKYQELTREVHSMRTQLPSDIHSIEVQKVTPSDVNILQLALISENASRTSLKKEAERLQKELEKLPPLKHVEVSGLPEEVVRIDLRLEKLAQLNVPLNAVTGSLQSELSNIPGGSIEAGTKSFNVKTGGKMASIDEFKNIIVFSRNGANILLKDLADVHLDHEENKHITRLNGHRCVFITAAQKPGSNISDTKKQYVPVLEAFESSLPSNIVMVQNFDQAANVNKRLSILGKDFLIAILLVSVTLLPLGYRAAWIVMISIPLSLAIGLILLNTLGFNLNQLSIVGLVVALGLLVDDSIVVVENIERWLREGYSKLDAAILATKQISLAVVGCTVTLIIAFIPLVFLPEAPGDFIRSLPVAVIASVLASMFVSLTIIPFLSSRILKDHGANYQGNMFLRALQKLIHGSYARILERALQKPALTLVIAAAIFFASLRLFPVIGFSLFPMSEKPQFLIDIIAPLQSNIGYTDKVTKEVEKELAKISDVKYFATNVGKGNPRIYYNLLQENERTDYAQIFVQLEENTTMSRKLEITDYLIQKFKHFSDARIEVKNLEQGPPITAPVEVKLFGNNLDTLRSMAARVEDLLKQTEGTLYVNNPVVHLKSDVKLDVNKEKARMLGVNTVDIAKTVRLAVAGISAGSFTDQDGNDKKVILTTPKEERASLDAFDNLYVNNIMGTAIPLKQIADVKMEASPLFIRHLDKTRTVSVTSFVSSGYLVDKVINDVINKMKGMEFPKGYSYTMGGEMDARQESFGGFGSVIIVTVFLFIAVLILEFKTFKSTLIVLSVIPLGIVGAVMALWITGNSLSFVAIIGLIALAGIEVKNSILLVDFTNQLRESGKSIDEAIREAGEVRFLPIILTSLTAIGGLIPIAISSNPLISPLAIVLIGGLISSTVLSRIVTPVVYKLIPPRIKSKEQEVLQLA